MVLKFGGMAETEKLLPSGTSETPALLDFMRSSAPNFCSYLQKEVSCLAAWKQPPEITMEQNCLVCHKEGLKKAKAD